MSLLTKTGGGGSLSALAIDADKDWLGRLIKNLGLPVDDTDALRKQDAVLKAILTEAGQLVYAAAPGVPEVLAPDVGDKYLKAGAPPSWAAVPGGGFWETAADVTLSATSNILEATGIDPAYEILWVLLMSSWTPGSDICLRLNNGAGPYYNCSRYEVGSAFSRNPYDDATQITLAGPGGEGLVFYQFNGFIFQRLSNWRKTFNFTWNHTNSANGSNSHYIHQGYWDNQSSKVTSLRFTTSANYFDAQARLLVLGAR